MAMVDVDGSSLPADSGQVSWLGLRDGGHLTLGLHSSHEPGELSLDVSTINIVIGISIITAISH